jgi:hypothetical protein
MKSLMGFQHLTLHDENDRKAEFEFEWLRFPSERETRRRLGVQCPLPSPRIAPRFGGTSEKDAERELELRARIARVASELNLLRGDVRTLVKRTPLLDAIAKQTVRADNPLALS